MTSPLKGKFIIGLSKQITSDNSPFKTVLGVTRWETFMVATDIVVDKQ